MAMSRQLREASTFFPVSHWTTAHAAMHPNLWIFFCTWSLDRNTVCSHFFNNICCSVDGYYYVGLECLYLCFSPVFLYSKYSVFLVWIILRVTFCFGPQKKTIHFRYMKTYIKTSLILVRYSLLIRNYWRNFILINLLHKIGLNMKTTTLASLNYWYFIFALFECAFQNFSNASEEHSQ